MAVRVEVQLGGCAGKSDQERREDPGQQVTGQYRIVMTYSGSVAQSSTLERL